VSRDGWKMVWGRAAQGFEAMRMCSERRHQPNFRVLRFALIQHQAASWLSRMETVRTTWVIPSLLRLVNSTTWLTRG